MKHKKAIDKAAIPAAILATAILALSISVFASFVKAQPGVTGQSLEVSPPSQELSVKPGDTLQVKAKVRNRTANPLPIAVRLEDFVASGSEGQVALTEKGPWAVSVWTTVTPTNFVLEPNETKEVTATVKIPASGAAGGRYGSFVFSVSGTAGPGAAAISQEIASLFLIDIAGPRDEKLTITSFSAPDILEFGPVPFTIIFKNSGNVHLKAGGVIAVTDMFGRKVADVVQTPTNIFPGGERKITAKWDQKLLFGRYTAQAIINTNGTKNQTLTAETSFTVFPIRIAAIIILATVLLFLIRKRLSRAAKALLGK